jgi:16S rRNA (uracil1498-N3)-methyltransferase
MLRVFHPGPWPEPGAAIHLDADESSHLVRVRRARAGEEVEVLDGRGGVATGTLLEEDTNEARLRVVKITRHSAPAPRLLAVGLPKGDVFTEIIRQATELGATAVQPLLTTRTEVRLTDDARASRKLERWRATALEACKQSGNPWLPEIHAPMPLAKWLAALPSVVPPGETKECRLVAALTPAAKPIRERSPLCPSVPLSLRLFVIAIGPEGDFSPAEYTALQTAGFRFVKLPGHVLRVETACAVALASL